MKIQCEIIRDILPLYAEDMVSQPTREMVEEHLDECEACAKELTVLRSQPIPTESGVTTLNRVKKAIRHRRTLAVMSVFFFVATLLIGGGLLLDAPIYLTAEQAIESVEALEDGTIRIHPTDIVATRGSQVGIGEDDPSLVGNYGVVYATKVFMLLCPQEKTPYEEMPEEVRELVSKEDWGTHRYQFDGGASSYNFWYLNPWDGTVETLLWDAGNAHPQVPLKKVNYHLAYYVVILAFMCAACAFLERKIRRSLLGKIVGGLGVFFGSVAVSVLIVTAGQLVELWGEFTEAFLESLIVAIPMCLCALCIRQLILLNRKDKGL